jgi:hypothetical protein
LVSRVGDRSLVQSSRFKKFEMQYYTGFPELTTVSVGHNTVSLMQGTPVVAMAQELS